MNLVAMKLKFPIGSRVFHSSLGAWGVVVGHRAYRGIARLEVRAAGRDMTWMPEFCSPERPTVPHNGGMPDVAKQLADALLGTPQDRPKHTDIRRDVQARAGQQVAEKFDATMRGGMKFDSDKVRMDLLMGGMPNALEGIAKVLTFGAKKYAAHSWRTVPDGDARYDAALHRHLNAMAKGETHDAESGLPHIYHALCCLMFRAELQHPTLAKIDATK